MSQTLSAAALIVAAGNSTRMGGNNKQFLVIDGIPVLVHTLSTFSAMPEITELVIVTREDDIPAVQNLAKEFSIPKIKAIIPGGDTRQGSVFCGLRHVTEGHVLIHDGARPFVTENEIRDLLEVLKTSPAGALGVPAKDTIKRINRDGLILETLPREELVQIQTPQGFVTDEILAAHQKAAEQGVSVTDDCALAESMGIPVKVIPGSYRNIKITTPEDIPLAEAFSRKK